MVQPEESPRAKPGLEKQVRLQVRFSGGPPGWALAYGALLERQPSLRLLSLRIVSSEHAEYIVLSHTPAGLAATLVGLEGVPAESIEVRGDSLFASIAPKSSLHEMVVPSPELVTEPAPGLPAVAPSVASALTPHLSRHGHLSLVHDEDESPAPDSSAGVDHLGLAVGPFRRFSEVNRFIDALGAVQDVRSVKPRRFRRGTLYALVDYVGAVPFASALGSIRAFPLRVTSTLEDRIEATLLESEALQLRDIA